MTTHSQRWRERRDSYRLAGEVIQTAAYEVAAIADDTTPKAFVVRHHYSASYPAARFRMGLYRREELVGVAVFSHPCRNEVLTNVFPGDPLASVELGRFVLLDDVPSNGETWFLARCFRLLRGDVSGVLSMSDPVPRRAADGHLVTPGHVGCIYAAHNGVFLGRATPRTLRLLPNGTVFSDRAQQKIRARDQGWRYAVEQLVAAGAPTPPAGDLRGWMRAAMALVTRTVRHKGNFKYAWALDHAYAKTMVRPGVPLAYPKQRDVEAAA